LFCHLTCSAIAGFTAVTVGSPVDVVKTRFMNQDKTAKDAYKGVVDTFVRTFKEEGPLAFYKGFAANATRIISWNIVVKQQILSMKLKYHQIFLFNKRCS
jgi:solute carrier family 25 uncoupling protein 8/9